jgi:hypothetical protein
VDAVKSLIPPALNERNFRLPSDRAHAFVDRLVSTDHSSTTWEGPRTCSGATFRCADVDVIVSIILLRGYEDLMAPSRFSIRSPSRFAPLHLILASISIIPLDYFTGPYLDSMVLLYPIPAAMAAWSGSPRWSIALAAALPPVRMFIFHYWGWQAPALEAVLDTTVIVLFSIAVALIILHLRRQGCRASGRSFRLRLRVRCQFARLRQPELRFPRQGADGPRQVTCVELPLVLPPSMRS